MTEVFVPLTNSLVFGAFPHDVRPEVFTWIDNHIKGRWRAPYRWGEDGQGPAVGVEFHFSSPDEAMLFKLTWAGK